MLTRRPAESDVRAELWRAREPGRALRQRIAAARKALEDHRDDPERACAVAWDILTSEEARP